MKKLIVSGDSCTEPYFYSVVHPEMDFDFPKWPDHLGKHLGMEVINLARGGAGTVSYTHLTLATIWSV